jgi:hypothetical protein
MLVTDFFEAELRRNNDGANRFDLCYHFRKEL